MSFDFGERCFAKVKGFPHWPARINCLPGDVKIPKGKYPIFFYGTHEVCFLSGNAIFPYEKFKSKYGVARNTVGFNNGLEEMETNSTIYQLGIDPKAIDFLSQFYTFSMSELADLQPNSQPNKSATKKDEENSDLVDTLKKESQFEDSHHMDIDQKNAEILVIEQESVVVRNEQDSQEFKKPNYMLKHEPMDDNVLGSNPNYTGCCSNVSALVATTGIATVSTSVASTVHGSLFSPTVAAQRSYGSDPVVNVPVRKSRHIKHCQPPGGYVSDFTNLLLEIRKCSWSKTKISDIKKVMKKNKTDSRVRIFFPWYQSLAKK